MCADREVRTLHSFPVESNYNAELLTRSNSNPPPPPAPAHAQFNTYVSSGVLLQNYAHVFDLLIRLRQAVDHPYLVVYSQTAGPSKTNKPLAPADA